MIACQAARSSPSADGAGYRGVASIEVGSSIKPAVRAWEQGSYHPAWKVLSTWCLTNNNIKKNKINKKGSQASKNPNAPPGVATESGFCRTFSPPPANEKGRC